MLNPGTIKKLGININAAPIETYTQAKPQEICSFIKCVLPKHYKHEEPMIKNWIVHKRKHKGTVKYEEIVYFLNVMLKPEIVQRLYNAIFDSVC